MGEPYRDNLRRFYEHRLASSEDLKHIDDYIERGIVRHRSQIRPFSFEHRGRWLRVAVQTIPSLGRVRTWTQIDAPSETPIAREATLPADISPPSAQVSDLPDGVAVLDRANRIISYNDQFRHLYGMSPQDHVLGSTYEDIVRRAWRSASLDGSDDRFEATVLPHLREEQRFTGAPFEVPLPYDRWVRVIEQRSAEGLRSSVHFDISLVKREHRNLRDAEALARRQEARFRAVIERSPVGTSIAKCDGELIEVNDAYGRVFGYRARELIGGSLWDLLDLADLEQARNDMRDLAANRIPSLERELRFRHKDGSQRWVIHSAVLLAAGDGSPDVVISQIQDITSRKLIEAERDALLDRLAHQAAHDSLTGLPNRVRFEEELALAFFESRQSAHSHAVCFIDLDRFKIINDTAGHIAGDALLRQVGLALRDHSRSSDVIARIGGDEFGLLLKNCTVEDAEGVARELADAVTALRLIWQNETFTVGISIGIAALNAEVASVAEAVNRADQACYMAKRAGRNCIRVYETGTVE